MSAPLLWIISAVAAYLLGSVSTGLLVARFAHGPDLHSVGSGSTGASNVQRTMGWKYGLITFAGDALKAVAACLLGRWLTGEHTCALLCGLAVVIGHNWPVFFGFKGGKGVASSCGVMVCCYPIPAVICFVLTVGLIALLRYISVGSMFMLTLYAVLVSVFWSGGNPAVILWAVVMAVLCIWRHRSNISRLIHGNENKLGHKAG